MAQSSPTGRGMRTFLIIWAGQLVSLFGSGLTSFALAVWLYEQTGAATPFAVTVLLANLPRIVLAPFAGALVDRWNRRRVMILADSGSALVTVAAAVLLFTGELSIGAVYLIAFCNSIFGTFQEPAFTASMTLLVPKKELTRTNGLMQMGQAVEMLLVPLVAGILFLVIGLRGIILLDFATYLVAMAALLLVEIPQPPPATAVADRPTTIWKDAVYGWHYLRLRTGLLGLLFYFALVNFLLNSVTVLVVPLVLTLGNAGSLGAVQTAGGVGLLAGSILVSAWGGPQKRILAVIGFISLSAFGLLAVGLSPSLYLVGSGLFLLLFFISMASAASQAIFQVKVEPAVQGRVFAIRSMVSHSMMPLGFVVAGFGADRMFEPWMAEGGLLAPTLIGQLLGVGPGRGIGVMFLLSGIVLLVAGVLAYAHPRIRRIEEELPDCVGDTAVADAAAVPAIEDALKSPEGVALADA
jgi:MFS transporter, DHA3 family, macrolide efflux protein